jgi:AraC-like DNA-binding protein
MSATHHRFVVDLGWRALLRDLGVSEQDLLRHARLPLDLFSRAAPALSSEEYFRLYDSLGQLVGDPAFPLRIGQAVSVEVFSPPLFACFCSPHLNAALQRLAQYKPLIGPVTLEVAIGERETVAALGGLAAGLPPPASFIAAELVFLVQMARLATRERLVPARVTVPAPLVEPERYGAFFGTDVRPGSAASVVFHAEDAGKPFLTASESMWSVFEPELRTRLAGLRREDGCRERVRACLMESLAAGHGSMAEVADRLAVSTRTLQRRLREEGTSFQHELNRLREELAHHYLVQTHHSSAEISFLLGYDDPNSFIRAFHGWTGLTPERSRAVARQA